MLTAANTSTIAPLITSVSTSLARHRRSLHQAHSLAAATAELHASLIEQGAMREAVIVAAQEELQALPATFFRPFRKLQQQEGASAAGGSEGEH